MWTRILLAAIPLLAADALAQTQSERGRPSAQPQRVQPAGVRPQAPRTRSLAPRPTNLGGVKAKAPRPIKKLGGVKVPFQRPMKLGGVRQDIGFHRQGPTSRTVGDGPRPGPVYRSIDNQYNKTIFELPSAPRDIDRPRDGRNARHPRDAFFDRIDDVRRGRRGHDGRPIIFHDPHTGVITTGSGLSVNGSFEDDNFRLGFHLGSPFVFDGHKHRRRHHHHHDFHDGSFFTFPSWGYFGGSYYDWNAYDTMYGSYAAYDPNLYYAPIQPDTQPVTLPTPPATEFERAQALLSIGEAGQAIAAFKDHLDANPGDTLAMRGLGLALIADAQLQDGVAMVALAYKQDPALAAEPIPANLFGTDDDLRAMVERVSIFSNRTKLPSAWLTLAALMQAEGRAQLASRMVDRALRAGLEPGLAAQMQAVLKS